MTKVNTLSDIAKLAGVSESTVSRALAGSKLVNAKTRDKIAQIADELDFTVNTTARNLRLKKTNTVAIVLRIDSEQDQSASDPFILSLLGIVADELRAIGYDLLLISDTGKDQQWVKNLFNSKRVDGVIVFGQGDNNTYPVNANKDRPIIIWGEQDSSCPYTIIGTNNFLGGKLATQHLLEQGCKNIVFAGHISYETGARFNGYKEAIKEAGLHYSQHIDVHFTYAEGYAVAKSIVEKGGFHYDGIVAASDTIALGMMKALMEQGVSIPDEVAIVGYDDIAVSGYTHPSLTTIRQNMLDGGKQIVNLLNKLMQGEKVESITLQTELVQRESSSIKK